MQPSSPSTMSVTHAVFADPIVQLAALCPICALAALSPAAALAALSPSLRMFNPAINPSAALLAFVIPPKRVTGRVQNRVNGRLAYLQAQSFMGRFR